MTTATQHKIQLVDPTGGGPGTEPTDAGGPAGRYQGEATGAAGQLQGKLGRDTAGDLRDNQRRVRVRRGLLRQEAQRLAPAEARGDGGAAPARGPDHHRDRGLRGVLVGQFARRNHPGAAGHPHGHYHHRRVRHHSASLHQADGRTGLPVYCLSSPDHERRRRRPG